MNQDEALHSADGNNISRRWLFKSLTVHNKPFKIVDDKEYRPDGLFKNKDKVHKYPSPLDHNCTEE